MPYHLPYHDRDLPPPRSAWAAVGFPGLGALPGRAVEARASQARTGDLGPVRPAARCVGGVEPLGEELAQPLLARVAAHGQPLVEGGFEAGLAGAGPAVGALELLQRRVEPGRPEDLAQRDVGGAGPVVGV